MVIYTILYFQNKTCVQTLEGHAQNISAVAFHPELPIIMTGSEDGMCLPATLVCSFVKQECNVFTENDQNLMLLRKKNSLNK